MLETNQSPLQPPSKTMQRCETERIMIKLVEPDPHAAFWTKFYFWIFCLCAATLMSCIVSLVDLLVNDWYDDYRPICSSIVPSSAKREKHRGHAFCQEGKPFTLVEEHYETSQWNFTILACFALVISIMATSLSFILYLQYKRHNSLDLLPMESFESWIKALGVIWLGTNLLSFPIFMSAWDMRKDAFLSPTTFSLILENYKGVTFAAMTFVFAFYHLEVGFSFFVQPLFRLIWVILQPVFVPFCVVGGLVGLLAIVCCIFWSTLSHEPEFRRTARAFSIDPIGGEVGNEKE